MQIVIADANPTVRKGLRLLLEQQPGWQVAGDAAQAVELLYAAGLHCPDLVLLDWELPGMPIDSLVVALRRLCPRTVLVGLGRGGEQRQHAARLAMDAFASKTESAENLLGRIQAALLPGKPVAGLVR